MTDASAIREHMEVIGADGVHIGTVDQSKAPRIKLTKANSGAQIEGAEGRMRAPPLHLARPRRRVEGDQVRLSATGANAVLFEEEEGG